MTRPRWHDALIVSAIVGLLAAGVWSLWWEDVRSLLKLDRDSDNAVVPVARGQT